MSWVALSLLSALFLGFFDLSKKHAVNANAVLPVLFWSTVAAAVLWAPLVVLSSLQPGMLPASLAVAPLTGVQHLQILLKSTIVAASWTFSYFALKHLPLTIAGPIRASGPLWTLLGALAVFSERPSAVQWAGIAVTLPGFFALSLAGHREGIEFHRNRWVGFMVAGTVLGGISTLWDKYLFGVAGFDVPTVQAWFFIYLSVLFLPLIAGWRLRWWPRREFAWRWSIPAIGLALLVADYAYFTALRDPSALVSVVACLRRVELLVSFAGGILLFREPNGLRKLPAVLCILAGTWIMVLG